jgi:tRNA1Val (adenine37-N6)-methyltransferase
VSSAAPAASPSAAEAEARRLELEAELGEGVTLDQLARHTRIFQRAGGHRHSTDDWLTAWYAVHDAPLVTEHLDLGTGIGSVGLLVLGAQPAHARLTAVEAQAISARFFRENLWLNGWRRRVDFIEGDLREVALEPRFPLVTGSPPYFPNTAGIVPRDSQKAHARFELRGSVVDYCKAARRALAPGGRFVFCFPTPQLTRALAAIDGAGLALWRRRDVLPRAAQAPLFTLFECGLEARSPLIEPAVTVRDAAGAHTAEYHAARASFGW